MNFLVRWGLWVAYRGLRLYWLVARPETDGTGVVVRLGGRVLCIRNSYRPGLFLPGGAPHRGEPLRDAAARELREEVALELSSGSLEPLGVVETRAEHKRDRIHLFGAALEQEPELRVDDREVVWAGFLTPDEMRRDRLSPAVRAVLDGLRS